MPFNSKVLEEEAAVGIERTRRRKRGVVADLYYS